MKNPPPLRRQIPRRVGFAAISQRHRTTHWPASFEELIQFRALPREPTIATASAVRLHHTAPTGAEQAGRRAVAAIASGFARRQYRGIDRVFSGHSARPSPHLLI